MRTLSRPLRRDEGAPAASTAGLASDTTASLNANPGCYALGSNISECNGLHSYGSDSCLQEGPYILCPC